MTVTLAMQIEVKGKDEASKMFDGIGKSAQKATAEIKGSVGGMTGAAVAMSALTNAIGIVKQGYDAVIGTIKMSVGAYMDAEAGTNKMVQAMKNAGTYTDSALKSFEKFASQIMKTTKYDDDAVISLIALGKAAGYTDETTKAMVVAATNLATVQNTELRPAFEALQGSMIGQTRAIAKNASEVLRLTPIQLAQGAAIDLVNTKWKDYAKNVDSLENSHAKMNNSFDDFIEKVGKAIVDFVDLKKQMETSKSFFETLSGVMDRIDFSKLGDAFGKFMGLLFAGTSSIFSRMVDLITLNMNKVEAIWNITWSSMKVVALQALKFIYQQFAGITMMFGGLAGKWQDKVDQIDADTAALVVGVNKSKENLAKGWELGMIGDLFDAFKGLWGDAKEAEKETEDQTYKANEAAKLLKKSIDDAVNAFNDLEKTMLGIARANEEFGKTDSELADMSYQRRLKEISLVEDQLRKVGQLMSKQKEFENFRKIAQQEYAQKKGAADAKELEDAINKEMSFLRHNEVQGTDLLVVQLKAELQSAKALVQWFEVLAKRGLEISLDETSIIAEAEHAARIIQGKLRDITIYQPMLEGINAVKGGFGGLVDFIGSKFGVIGQIIASLVKMLDMDPKDFKEFFNKLFDDIWGGFFDRLAENLPTLITAMVRSIGQSFEFLTQGFPVLIPKIILGMIGALVSAARELTIKTIDPKYIVNLVKGAFRQIGREFEKLFGGKGSDVQSTETVKSQKSVTTSYKEVYDTSAGQNEFRVREYEANQTTYNEWKTKVTEVTEAQGRTLMDMLNDLGQIIVDALNGVIPGLGDGLRQSIRDGWQWVGDNIITPFPKAVENAFKVGSDYAKDALALSTTGATSGVLERFVYWIGDFISMLAIALGDLFANLTVMITNLVIKIVFGIVGLIGGLVTVAIVGPFQQIVGFFKGRSQKDTTKAISTAAYGTANSIWETGQSLQDQVTNRWLAKPSGSSTNGTTTTTTPTREPSRGGANFSLDGEGTTSTSTAQTSGSSSSNDSGMFDDLANKMSPDFSGFADSIGNFFSDVGVKLWNGFWEKAQQLGTWLYEQGAKLWNGFWEKTSAITKWAADAGLELWNGFWNMTSKITKWAGDAGLALWNGFWNKVGEFNDTVVAKVKSWGSDIWNGFWNTLTGAWTTTLTKFQGCGNSIWNSFWNTMSAGWSSLTSWFGKTGVAIWDGFWNTFVGAWKSLIGWMGNVGSAIWDGLSAAIVKAWSFFSRIGREIWAGVGTAAGGGTSSASRVATAVATGGVSEAVRWVSSWHNGGTIQPLHFAGGGPVPGFGFTDSVPAMLTPGEHVLTQSQTAAMQAGQLGGTTINIHIAPNADVSENAIRRYLVPAVIDAIDRNTTNGRRFVNGRGVYGT